MHRRRLRAVDRTRVTEGASFDAAAGARDHAARVEAYRTRAERGLALWGDEVVREQIHGDDVRDWAWLAELPDWPPGVFPRRTA